MSYQVFARKYRPQIFDDVVGQEHITRTLKNAIAQNRLAHAYLFVGPRGTGKTSTARILAKALCCIHAPTTEPCGVCDPCREIAAGNSLDVLEIDGASNNGVEQVRELRDNVRYAPSRGKYKIYIIDEVHMLTPAAFNALLKTLEEPPEHVKFIFATTEPQKVLATILSRCQRFDLRRIPALSIAAHLQKIAGIERIELASDAAGAIARGAEGGLRDAESMLDQLVAFCGDKIAREDVLNIFGFTAPETVAMLSGHVLEGRTPEALAVLDAQSEAGKDLLRLLSEFIGHLRNLLVVQVNPGSIAQEVPAAMADLLAAQAAQIPTDRLLDLIDQFAAAEGRMKWAPNKKLHFEIALIKAIQTLGQATLTEVIDALSALRDDSAPATRNGAPSASGHESGKASTGTGSVVAEVPRTSFAGLKKTVAAGFAAAKPVAPEKAPTRETAPVPEVVPPAGAVPKPPPPIPVPSLASAAPAAAPSETAHLEMPAFPATPPPAGVAPAPALDGEQIWRELIEQIRSQRPLITSWVKTGQPVGIERNVLRVAFPSSQKMAVESLSKANNRQFLESLLSKLAATPISLKFELHDRDEPSEDGAGSLPQASAAAIAVHPKASPPDPESRTAADDPVEKFRNDPLIRKALQIFEGEIRSVEGPSAAQSAAA